MEAVVCAQEILMHVQIYLGRALASLSVSCKVGKK